MSVSTSTSDPVETVYDILANASATTGGYGISYGYVYGGAETWTHAAPEVHYRWERTQQYRERNPDPAVYLWSPDASDRPAFDAEYSSKDETQIVEASVWVLDTEGVDSKGRVVDYAGDIISLIEEYGNDNKGRTVWNTIRPSADNDFRAENVVRRADHFVVNVTIDLRRLADTGMVA